MSISTVDSRVVALAGLLAIPEPHALGLVMFIRMHADEADRATLGSARTVARIARWEGDAETLARALIECGEGEPGIIIEAATPGTYEVQDYAAHRSQRTRDRIRKQRQRAGNSSNQNNVTGQSRDIPGTSRDTSGTSHGTVQDNLPPSSAPAFPPPGSPPHTPPLTPSPQSTPTTTHPPLAQSGEPAKPNSRSSRLTAPPTPRGGGGCGLGFENFGRAGCTASLRAKARTERGRRGI